MILRIFFVVDITLRPRTMFLLDAMVANNDLPSPLECWCHNFFIIFFEIFINAISAIRKTSWLI